MTAPDATRVIQHLPEDGVYSLEITGGDPFSDYPLLLAVLEELGPSVETRRVTVHTTGQWAETEDDARARFRRVKELGAQGIDFLCEDEYHWMGGLDRANYELASRVAREVFGPDRVFVRKDDLSEGILPLGRGAATSMERFWGKGTCYVKTADPDSSMQMHIAHTGEAYVCSNMVAPAVGNMVTTSYEALIEDVRGDACHRALMGSGPMGLAEAAGLERGYWSERIGEVGECRACIELFRDWGHAVAAIPSG